MEVTFPGALIWETFAPEFVGQARSVQQSISGASTVVPTFAGHWEAEIGFAVFGERNELAYQAFLAQMEGQIGTTLVPFWTRHRPYDRNGHEVKNLNDGTVGGSLYNGDSGQAFEHFGFASNPVVTMSVGAAAARATDLRVSWNNTTGIRPGQFFSIGAHLYQVQLHWEDDQGHVIRIRPGLRVAVADGATAVLDKPVCRMRLMSEGGGLVHRAERLTRTTLKFVEAW